MLHKIAHELGAKTRPYPDERCVLLLPLSLPLLPLSLVLHHEPGPDARRRPRRYDIMWTLRNGRVVKKESERCPGLDPQHPRKHDGDLEIDVASVEDDDEEEEEGDLSVWDEYDAESSAAQWQLGGLDELD